MDEPGYDSLLMQVERIKQEAYAAGWRDALAAINKAVSSLNEPSTMQNGELRDDAGTPIQILLPASKTKLPKQGTTPWEVVQTVKKRPGLTGAQIIETMRTAGHNAPEPSIRTSIFRMKERKLIVSRHGKWYPA